MSAEGSNAPKTARKRAVTPKSSGVSRRTPVDTARLELRVARRDKDLIERAARASHVTTSAFVLRATRQAAEEILRRDEVTVVPPDFYDTMIASLDAPAEPNTPLADAARRRREALRKKQ